eukprot:7059-Heterococcus_DN1.PRE.1
MPMQCHHFTSICGGCDVGLHTVLPAALCMEYMMMLYGWSTLTLSKTSTTAKFKLNHEAGSIVVKHGARSSKMASSAVSTLAK